MNVKSTTHIAEFDAQSVTVTVIEYTPGNTMVPAGGFLVVRRRRAARADSVVRAHLASGLRRGGQCAVVTTAHSLRPTSRSVASAGVTVLSPAFTALISL